MSSAPSAVQPAATELPEATGGCPACPHPLDAHDPISLRFCQATTAGATTRGCVCPSP